MSVRVRRCAFAASLIGCAVEVCGCSSPTQGAISRARPPTPVPPVAAVHVASIPRQDLTAGRLDLVSGTDSLLVTSADLGDGLVRVETPATSSQVPRVSGSRDGQVSVSLADVGGSGASGGRQLNIVLDTKVAWTVSLDGGASYEQMDLTGARLRGSDPRGRQLQHHGRTAAAGW